MTLKVSNKKEILISIVLPLRDTVHCLVPMLKSIKTTLSGVSVKYEVIVVGDKTQDGLARIVKKQEKASHIRFIDHDTQSTTSATAHGIRESKGVYICCLDLASGASAANILVLLEKMIEENADIVVASRYMKGYDSAKERGKMYGVATRVAKYFTYCILPLSRKSTDPASGCFILSQSIRELISLDNIAGNKILLHLLVQSPYTRVSETIYVRDTKNENYSTSDTKRGFDFLKTIVVAFVTQQVRYLVKWLFVGVIGLFFSLLFYQLFTMAQTTVEFILLTASTLMFCQALFMLYLMIYAWENPERVEKDAAPKEYLAPSLSFTLFLAARHEEAVITDTIKSISRINYPEHLLDTFVLINEEDDAETIRIAQKAIDDLEIKNIHLKTFQGPLGKSVSLNYGLANATSDIVSVIDAEDEVHKEILNVVNTTMIQKKVDVVQGGVQLMNFYSSWYSLFNVMEYFFWFKSALHFFANHRIIPLGGNTVFFKRSWLDRVNGWEEGHLTEDADIGIRLSLAGAKTSVVYEAEFSTREETPSSIADFIKQRTRWNQGFIYTVLKGEWRKLPTFKQRALAFYILSWSVWQGLIFLMIPFSVYAALTIEMTPILGVLANLPLFTLAAIYIVVNVGIYDFMKIYGYKYKIKFIFITAVFFIPYQLLLGIGAFRGLWRQIIVRDISWEKTTHLNVGREGNDDGDHESIAAQPASQNN